MGVLATKEVKEKGDSTLPLGLYSTLCLLYHYLNAALILCKSLPQTTASYGSRDKARKKFSRGILLCGSGQSFGWGTRKSPSLGFLSCELDPDLSDCTLIEKSPGVEMETDH